MSSMKCKDHIPHKSMNFVLFVVVSQWLKHYTDTVDTINVYGMLNVDTVTSTEMYYFLETAPFFKICVDVNIFWHRWSQFSDQSDS